MSIDEILAGSRVLVDYKLGSTFITREALGVKVSMSFEPSFLARIHETREAICLDRTLIELRRIFDSPAMTDWIKADWEAA